MTRNRPLPIPVEELSFVLSLERHDPPLAWPALFGRAAPIEIEIGSGKGLFLVEAARANPEVDFVGVERAGKWFRRSADRILRSGLTNIRIVQADAFDFLARWVAPGSARTVHVYFPDPWPKKRHARRRLLQAELYRLAARALPEGGEFRLASDVHDYYEESIAELAADPLFRRDPWPEGEAGLPTNFAVKYRREGRSEYCARYVRLPGAAALDAASAPMLGFVAGGTV